ncbi:MAG: M13 family metallopeptidase [Lachnospiraceae bacterium]|nr:M13 family metallopeptidase [Lachnospiraceae bacterium]
MRRMNKLLAIILIGVMLTVGCTNTGDGKTPAEKPTDITGETSNTDETSTIDETPAFSSVTHTTSWIDGAIKENLPENMDISLKDDFHLYVNYDWLKNTELPEGYSSWTSFSEAAKMTRERELSVIMDESLAGHDAELVRALYNAYLDWDERNETGIEPLAAKIKQIDEIETLSDLTELITDKENGRYIPKFVKAKVEPCVDDSSKYIVTLRLMGHYGAMGSMTGYTDRQYTAEKTFFADMMERLGYSRIDAAQVFETAIMRVNTNIYSYLVGKNNITNAFFAENTVIVSKDELGKIVKNFPLVSILESQGLGDVDEYQVVCPESFSVLDTIYTDSNLSNLKKYMTTECVLNMSQFLDRQASDYILDFKKSLYGIEGGVSDEEHALSTVEAYLDIPLTRMYLQKYGSSEMKKKIYKLIEQIISEYREMLAEEDWLSEETRKKAIEKLNAMKINVMYPDKWDDGFIMTGEITDNDEADFIEWDDYTNLDLSGLTYLEIMKAIEDYNKEKDLSRVGRAVDTSEWKTSTLSANACYVPQDNSINIFLGIMGGVFYHKDISDEELYACLGTIIGHEISHAFDTIGASYDKNGDYKDWWDHEDYVTFQNKANKLIGYMESLTKNLNWSINGQRICGEAIADMAGMKVILRLTEKKEGFDYKKFFVSYAELWREVSTYETELYQNQVDTHPLNYIRANAVLQQFDEFLETFDIKEGDTMYLDTKDRVCIW